MKWYLRGSLRRRHGSPEHFIFKNCELKIVKLKRKKNYTWDAIMEMMKTAKTICIFMFSDKFDVLEENNWYCLMWLVKALDETDFKPAISANLYKFGTGRMSSYHAIGKYLKQRKHFACESTLILNSLFTFVK